MNKEDAAYTSASTAENQKESEKVYAEAPIIPLASITAIFPLVNSPVCKDIFFAKAVMLQNKKRIDNDEHNAEKTLSAAAIPSTSVAKSPNILAIIIHKGAPGG